MLKIQEKVLLKDYSTFRIGGPAKYFIEVKDLDELKRAIEWAKEKKEKFIILGGGSNVLFQEKGFNGLVIKVMNNEIELEEEDTVFCGAGAKLGSLVNFAAQKSLTGLEWAAGIPGTVGGAIRGNAGAFGSEMGVTTKEVIYFDLKKLIQKKCNNKECKFDYRQSVFKEFDNKIIWEVRFHLKKGDKTKIQAEINRIIKERSEKHPCLAEGGSAGSVFKNPIVGKEVIEMFEKEKGVKCKDNKVPAGWLIDMCDLKGYRIDGVQVSEKQANFILNVGDAKSDSVVILISLIKQKVRNTFGVQLEEEIEIVDY